MVRIIEAKYISPNDPDFDGSEGKVTLITRDIVFEDTGNFAEWTFRKIPKVKRRQREVIINLEECPVLNTVFNHGFEGKIPWFKRFILIQAVKILMDSIAKNEKEVEEV